MAEHWKLPDWIIDTYRRLNDNPEQLVQALHIAGHTEQPLLQQQRLDEQPVLNNWLNRPANTLVFTCGLVTDQSVLKNRSQQRPAKHSPLSG